jgi:hypothetical protein
MGAAMVRVVEHVHIARVHLPRVLADHGLDTFAHAAQVHGHVRRVGNQVARGIEERAAEVQALLDVDRVGRVLQLQAHLLGDVHEQVVEHFKQHRVHRGACGVLHLARGHAVQHQVVQVGQARRPARLHHRGGVLLGNDGGARDHVAGVQVFAHHQRGGVPFAARVHAHALALRVLTVRVHWQARLGGGIACNHGFDRHGLHHQALARHQEGKALAVGLFKGGLNAGQVAKRHHQGRVGAFVAHMHVVAHLHWVGADLLALQFGLGSSAQGLQPLGNQG